MLILREREICPHTHKCPYSQNCKGTDPNRNNTFTCNYINQEGIIESGKFRSPLDQTGKMQIINE